MVLFTSIIGAAAFFGAANALPRPDSAIGSEVAVSAPNGIIMSDTAELSSQLATAAATSTSVAAYASATMPPSYGYSSNSGSYGSGSSWDNSGSNNYGSSYQNSNTWASEASSTITYAPPAYTAAAATSSSWQSTTTAMYGSGSSNWGSMGNQGYDSCVQQCLASYSGLPPAATYVATATNTPPAGTGATHTVIVAPTQGVLRFIPFATNASVGDTIEFMWGANNHTVTKSSSLLPCNRSSDALFTSGTQNQGFVFTQVVNDTNPLFFYCATPTHCQKGMFGIINPPNALGGPTSVGAMMPSIAMNNSNVAAYSAYTNQQTASNPGAGKWGSNIDMSAMPDWAQESVAENVMYTRTFLAANPEVLKSDGSIDMSSSSGTPLMIPQDLSAAVASGPATPSGASAPSSAATTAAATEASSTPQTSTNGATSAISSSKVLTAFALAVAGFLAL
jgi:plastocyanin